MKTHLLLALLLLPFTGHAADALVIPLWPGVPPGSEGRDGAEQVRITDQGEHVVSGIHRPTLTVTLPDPAKATGAAIIICPGGGHRELWMDHEGYAVAAWLADHGIAAIILKYRLAREPGSTYRVDKESLADAQRAIRTVRVHAAEWSIDPARIGIMGFSAGGELAALAARQPDTRNPEAADPVERRSDRPAFQILIYPGNAKAIEPAAGHPPAFLLAGYDDRADISEGIAELYLRFKRAGIPAELHIYTGSGHGFGLRATNTGPVADWPQRLHDWLGERGFLTATAEPVF
jgi:acetyl esterase/lipase